MASTTGWIIMVRSMKSASMIRLSLAVLAAGLSSGCGTVLSYVDDQGGVYSGVKLDAALLGTIGKKGGDYIPVVPYVIPFSVIDMPLSAAADTLCLPVVLITGAHGANEHAD